MPARGTFAAEWPKNRPRSRSRLGIMGIKRPLSRAVGRFRRSLQTPHPPPHRPPGVADEPPQPTRSAMRVGEQLDRVIIYTILGRADLKGTPAFKALQQAWESLRVCYRGSRTGPAGGKCWRHAVPAPMARKWPACLRHMRRALTVSKRARPSRAGTASMPPKPNNRPLLIHACRRLSLARSPPLAGAHTGGGAGRVCGPS